VYIADPAESRNPFVNQVSFFYEEENRIKEIFRCRNPFVNQVSFFKPYLGRNPRMGA